MEDKQLFISYLGVFQVCCDGEPLVLPKSKKARALLAYLTMHVNGCSRQTLTSMLFADTQDPRGNLRWGISRLRSALGAGRISVNADFIRFASHFHSDLKPIDSWLPEQETEAQAPAADSLSHMEFLSDLKMGRLTEFESWRLSQESRINAKKQRLLNTLITENLGTDIAVDYAQRLVANNPSLEESWSLLIRSLKAIGDQAEANRTYERAKGALQREDTTVTSLLSQALRDTGYERFSRIDLASTQHRVHMTPTVLVNNCSLDAYCQRLFDDRTVSNAVHRAASVNSSMTVAARTGALQQQDIGESLIELAKSRRIDFVLSIALLKSATNLVAHIELTSVSEEQCCFHWNYRREASVSPLDFVDGLEAYCSARFELDFLIAMVTRVREDENHSLTAHDNFCLALPCIFSATGFDPKKAEKYLLQAIHLQPDFGVACAALAMVRTFIPAYNSYRTELDKTISYARRAIEICQNDAFVIGWMATVIAQLEKNLSFGHDLVQRALTINPYSILGHIAAAIISHYEGSDGKCLDYLDSIESIADVQPLKFLTLTCRAMCSYQAGDYSKSLTLSQQALEHNPSYIIALRYQLASLGQLNRHDDANELCSRIVALDPSENLAFFRQFHAYHDQQRAMHLIKGLTKAGLPESAEQNGSTARKFY